MLTGILDYAPTSLVAEGKPFLFSDFVNASRLGSYALQILAPIVQRNTPHAFSSFVPGEGAGAQLPHNASTRKLTTEQERGSDFPSKGAYCLSTNPQVNPTFWLSDGALERNLAIF